MKAMILAALLTVWSTLTALESKRSARRASRPCGGCSPTTRTRRPPSWRSTPSPSASPRPARDGGSTPAWYIPRDQRADPDFYQVIGDNDYLAGVVRRLEAFEQEIATEPLRPLVEDVRFAASGPR